MAANGDRKSARDLTAVAAIVVSGLVGFTGIVVGWKSSRDAQHETSRAQREQADLTELRSVLDNAAADLQDVRTATFDLMLASSYRDAPPRLVSRLRAAARTARNGQPRLEIRLGDSADAVKHLEMARREYQAAVVDVAGAVGQSTPAGKPSRQALRRYRSGESAEARFIAEAKVLVGSQLPDS